MAIYFKKVIDKKDPTEDKEKNYFLKTYDMDNSAVNIRIELRK